MRTIGVLAVLLVSLLSQAPADNLVGNVVGDLGDPRRLEFRGIEAFPEEKIRDALSTHLGYQFAAHPAGPRQQLLSSVQELVERGYRRVGFPQAKVAAVYQPEADRVLVTVAEGTRIRAGEIRVKGDARLDVAQLIQSLTAAEQGKSLGEMIADAEKDSPARSKQGGQQDSDKTNAPLWSSGQPVAFDSVSAETRNRGIKDALADLGFLQAKFSVVIQPSPGSDLADLLITIEELGTPCVIGEICVNGLERNDRESFVAFLGLKEGQALTADLLRRLNRQLYESARFWEFRIVPESLDTRSSRFRLSIEVVEYPPAPTLDADFSPVQRLLLGLREQMENFADLKDDLVIRGEGHFDGGELGSLKSVTCVVAPSGGVLLSAHGLWGSQRPAQYAVVMTPDEIGLYSGGRGENYRAGVFGKTLVLTVSTIPEPRTDAGEFRSSLNFGAELRSEEEQLDAVPVNFQFRVAPVAMLREAVRGDVRVTTREGVTRFERKEQVLALDAQTGRLIEWTWHNSETGARFVVSSTRGEFARRVAVWQEQLAPGLNYHHPQAPFASLVAFLGDEWTWVRGGPPASAPAIQKRLSLLSRLVDETIVAGLQKKATARGAGEKDDRFRIPSDEPLDGVPKNQVQLFILGGASLLPGLAEQFFPRHSWPWTLGRETGFFIHGKRTYTAHEIRRLLASDEIGPLGCLAIGRALAFVSPDAARLFGAKGKAGSWTLTEFRKDSRMLTTGDELMPRATRRVAGLLRDAEPEEIEAVAEMLPDDVAAWLKRCVAKMRVHEDRPPENTLRDSFDELWQGPLSVWTRGELEELSQAGAKAR